MSACTEWHLENATNITITTNSSWTYFPPVLLKTCNCYIRNLYWYLSTSALERHPLTCIIWCYCKAFAVYWSVQAGFPWISLEIQLDSHLISSLWSNLHQWLRPIKNFFCGYSDLLEECPRLKNLLEECGGMTPKSTWFWTTVQLCFNILFLPGKLMGNVLIYMLRLNVFPSAFL